MDEKKCAACKHIIKDRRYLSCVLCSDEYDIECVNVPECRFYNTMTVEHKKKWVCPQCKSKQAKLDNTNTPVRLQFPDTVGCYSASSTNMKYSTPDNNVTTRNRNKVIVNISTENSFSSLSEGEELGDTILPQNIALNRSLPEKLNYDKIQEIEELELKVNTLRCKLESAEQEIDNLLSQNYALQKELSSQKSKVNCLNTICKTTPKSQKTCKRKKRQIARTALNFTISSTNSEREIHPSGNRDCVNVSKMALYTDGMNNSPPICRDRDDIPLPSARECRMRETTRTIPVTDDEEELLSVPLSIHKKRILLLADETGRELRKTLEKIIGEDYIITSILRPYSSLSQIVTNENDNFALYRKEFTKNDYIIILAGTHDRNLNVFKNALDYCFKSFLNTNVIIGKINHNQYFNVYKLNELIHNMSTNIRSARFVELSYRNNYAIDKFNTCRQIVLDIMLLNYKNKQQFNATKTAKSVHTQTQQKFFLN